MRGSQFENNYFTEMYSGSEAGSYLRLIDFEYLSTQGVRVIKKRRRSVVVTARTDPSFQDPAGLMSIQAKRFPVTCNPSRAVTLPNIGVPHYIGVPHRVTYPYVGRLMSAMPSMGRAK